MYLFCYDINFSQFTAQLVVQLCTGPTKFAGTFGETIFTIGEAAWSTCGNSHEEKKKEKKKEKERFHLSLHKPSYDHILGFPDLGFPDFEIPGFWASRIFSSQILSSRFFTFPDFEFPRF